MRTINAAVRTAYLSGNVTPAWEATITRLRLDFGGAPIVYKTSGVIEAGSQGDDFYNRHVWGDSCITAENKLLVRVINAAAWGGTSNFLASASDQFTYTDITNWTLAKIRT